MCKNAIVNLDYYHANVIKMPKANDSNHTKRRWKS